MFKRSDQYLFFQIGNSTSFKEILIKNDFNIVEEKIFTDHYNYKNKDILEIIELAKKKKYENYYY